MGTSLGAYELSDWVSQTNFLIDYNSERNLYLKQGNRWKRGMLPKCLLSIKGRSCNQTSLVHQDMTLKTK